MNFLVAPSGGTTPSKKPSTLLLLLSHQSVPWTLLSPIVYKPGLILEATELNGECQFSVKKGPVVAVKFEEGEACELVASN
jgi:hypothetical protein